MSVREYIHKWLTDRGLWPDEATVVVESTMKQEACDQVKWNDSAECYPPQLLAVLALSARELAVKYIDENKPKHFARPMFAVEA